MDTHVNFEKFCNEAQLWVHEIARDMRAPERTDWALHALRAVMHTLRDRTTVQEVFHLSAQMPTLIRGFYFEGYDPRNKPVKMNAEEFLASVKNRMGPGVEVPAGEAVRAVMSVLYDKVSRGELDDIRGSMPKDIQKIWDHLMPEESETD
ncbi:DUF2267 domain-containing protein [Rhodohalobacter mucosus]|uniref:DUF2267 domain-containing protein n=1 Tax=Rhodohalobacter mucosus TaxID=2079485 RepID=A0A316TVL6_9BACT|nr:DUF2267 domain-containing protein [Rhodohalobacter mucosus]PWN06542.1 DUF2267 domain-containing protein [Rhodohalobacter mucosus]